MLYYFFLYAQYLHNALRRGDADLFQRMSIIVYDLICDLILHLFLDLTPEVSCAVGDGIRPLPKEVYQAVVLG